MNTTQIQEKWFTSHDNLTNLYRYLVDKDGQESLDIVDFLEKPWKWENEWNEYQISVHIDDDLDVFDRRDK